MGTKLFSQGRPWGTAGSSSHSRGLQLSSALTHGCGARDQLRGGCDLGSHVGTCSEEPTGGILETGTHGRATRTPHTKARRLGLAPGSLSGQDPACCAGPGSLGSGRPGVCHWLPVPQPSSTFKHSALLRSRGLPARPGPADRTRPSPCPQERPGDTPGVDSQDRSLSHLCHNLATWPTSCQFCRDKLQP